VLTDNCGRIYSDNIAMTRWLQNSIQGMLNAETGDASIPVTEAKFTKYGDFRDSWTKCIESYDEEIEIT